MMLYQTLSYRFVTSLDPSMKPRKMVLMDGMTQSAWKDTQVERGVLPRGAGAGLQRASSGALSSAYIHSILPTKRQGSFLGRAQNRKGNPQDSGLGLERSPELIQAGSAPAQGRRARREACPCFLSSPARPFPAPSPG